MGPMVEARWDARHANTEAFAGVPCHFCPDRAPRIAASLLGKQDLLLPAEDW